MVGIIILVILVPVVTLILLISILNRTGEQRRLLESLYDEVKLLQTEIHKLSRERNEGKTAEAVKPVTASKPPEVRKEEQPVPVPESVKPKEEPFIAGPTLPELLKPVIPVNEIQDKPVSDKAPYIPGFIDRNKKEGTDYEKFIGENITNKIGIAILVLGISFFIKYAIDKDWVHEGSRVIIGLISGSILLGLAHYFRNQYRYFSSVLVGGGLTVFYFSVAYAFHQYHLIGQSAAFIFMVIISSLGVFLSLFYNRQELAILATIGGFITPFLVSTGQENYAALFTYLCILNTGLMVLAWFKRWPAINTIALVFTTVIYGSWLTRRLLFTEEPLPREEAFLFATLFYLLFVVMHIVNSIRLKNKFTGFDFLLLLSTSFLYYLAGMLILDNWQDGEYKGVFTGLLGLFNLLLAVIFYPQKSTDRHFVSLLIGLALSFLSLVAPVQFDGNQITLFWSAELVVLFWLYTRSRILLLKVCSLLVTLVMLISLIIDWADIYLEGTESLPILLNKGFITSLVAAVSLFLYYGLQKKEPGPDFYKGIPAKGVRTAALSAAILIAYLSGIFEIGYQFSNRSPGEPVSVIYWQCYTNVFVLILLYLFRKDPVAPILRLCLSFFSFAIYVFGMSSTQTCSLYLVEESSGLYFTAHWAAAGLLLWLLYQLIRFFFKKENERWADYRQIFTWLLAAGIVLVLSVEMYHLNIWSNYRDAADWPWWENLYYKAGLSILWGLCSFGMMMLGMRKDFKTLRIISLTLFTVTIGKLFLYDIINIPPGGKIAAFVLLGVLLLAVSFMYQRLKKIILDNDRSA